MSRLTSSIQPQDRHRIWVTRELDAADVDAARKKGLEPVIRPAIRIVHLPPNPKISLPDSAIWIFTSKNGVTGFSLQRQSGTFLPDCRAVFAVGEQTAEALATLGLEADWPANENATGLAHLILRWIDMNVDESERHSLRMVHWCGNRSRPELAEALQKSGYDLIRYTVYKTECATVHPPEPAVEAILFYSPSAVESIRHSNAWPDPMPRLYAIGPTTAEVLSLESNHPVHMPDKPSTSKLLDLVASELNRQPDLPHDTES